ncbi:hypothetical protein HOD75_04795 [archaeon]|jgi:2-(3-amino-3-carboxypropyl)histidine synthase|nr:hypothetical protein [archaeon]MBT4242182.1 hypothetical protein [archaeon]MBT4417870.1 hypothetical protein [archaeon]
MKILYIESKSRKADIKISKSEIKKLPKKIFLAYTVQFKDFTLQFKKQLKENKIQVEKTQQVLGCSKINTKSPILLIGTGRFHALNLYLQAPSVFILEGDKITKIPESEIQKLKQKRKTALIKFLHAENIGILVSTKPGQENLKIAEKIKKQLIKQKKKPYIFLANNIDINQFENFNIQSWINTSCPGLANDNTNILNHTELPKK